MHATNDMQRTLETLVDQQFVDYHTINPPPSTLQGAQSSQHTSHVIIVILTIPIPSRPTMTIRLPSTLPNLKILAEATINESLDMSGQSRRRVREREQVATEPQPQPQPQLWPQLSLSRSVVCETLRDTEEEVFHLFLFLSLCVCV